MASSDTIVDQTLSVLRDQQDDQQNQDFQGNFNINPQVYQLVSDNTITQELKHTDRAYASKILQDSGQERRHTIYGPIDFDTNFADVPNIFFAQISQAIVTDVSANSVATNYTPFLVHSYTYKLIYTNGEVSGFYVGLYAITAPPRNVFTHTICWRASGKGSRYKQQGQDEAWQSSYDYNASDFLQDDSATLESDFTN